MPYEASFDENVGLVCVRVYGMAPHDEHVAAHDEAMRICQENKCPFLLVDLSSLNTSRSTIMSCFDFGTCLSETRPFAHVALVLPADHQSRDHVIFTANVAANRGGWIKEFDTVDAAKKWLLDQREASRAEPSAPPAGHRPRGPHR